MSDGGVGDGGVPDAGSSDAGVGPTDAGMDAGLPCRPTPIEAGDGGALPGTVIRPCASPAAACPTDFTLLAPCRIVMVGGGSVELSVAELTGFPAGSYAWSTTSTKLNLSGTSGSSVTVVGLAAPSAARDAEVVTVTRTATGCAPITKTVKLTVARLTFSASAAQRYGYDNFDTPADPLDDHLSIKRSDHSFVHVEIEGGALGTDFTFACTDAAIGAPVAPGGAASFDLRVNAGAQNKADTVLHARCGCPAAHSFAHLAVHVYKERLVEVVVGKFHDKAVAATALNRPAMDASTHTTAANASLKEAVVRCEITNLTAANTVTDVRFDLDGNGALSYDIAADGGPEVDAIAAAFPAPAGKTRIAIVKQLKSYYYLSEAAPVGTRVLKVRGAKALSFPPAPTPLGVGANQESVVVGSVVSNKLVLAAGVTKAHPVGTPIEFPAGGWASDPIIVAEQNSADGSLMSEDAVLWAIVHEAGHRALDLADVDDPTSVMHLSRTWTDHRLRYCPRTRQYPRTSTENQWEHIKRPPDAP